jgi:hypothetical protein
MSMMDRGMQLAIGILVVGVLVAFLLPTAINSFNEQESQTIVQQENETVNVTAKLDSEATNIDSTGSEVTLELNDTSTGSSVSKTISENSNATYDLNNGEVTVNVTSINSDTEAELNYNYDSTYGWNDGSAQLYNLLPLFFILIVLFFVVGVAMSKM